MLGREPRSSNVTRLTPAERMFLGRVGVLEYLIFKQALPFFLVLAFRFAELYIARSRARP